MARSDHAHAVAARRRVRSDLDRLQIRRFPACPLRARCAPDRTAHNWSTTVTCGPNVPQNVCTPLRGSCPQIPMLLPKLTVRVSILTRSTTKAQVGF